MKLHKLGGFTLVEIMIVVAIIGLLAAIAVPNFVQARNSARTNTCVNNLRLLSAAKDQAALELGRNETATATVADVSAYLKNSAIPKEPIQLSSTAYTGGLNAYSVNPICAVSATNTGHTL